MEESNPVVYSLCVEDIQNVALEGFGRALTEGRLKWFVNTSAIIFSGTILLRR
jgi:hypothetical protein